MARSTRWGCVTLNAHAGRTVIVVLGVLFASASGVRGEATLALKQGARVRVVIADGATRSGIAGTRTLTGGLIDLSDSLLTLAVPRATHPVVLPRQDVASLAVSLRRDQRGTGALIGLGVGVTAGILIGQASGDDEECFICATAEAKSFLAALFLAPLGALIGVAVAPVEEWAFVPLDRVRFGFDSTTRSTPGVAITVGF